jgi:hypothetical protein
MRSFIAASVVASTLALAAMPAAAMPAVSAGVGSPTPAVTLVAGGCGIYFHRGPFGGCVRNGAGVVVVGPRVVGPRVGWRPGWRRPGWYHPGWRRGWRR